MARLQLDVDQETYVRLAESAVAERRPVGWQAEVLLRRALGLPVPPVGRPDPGNRPVAETGGLREATDVSSA